MGAAAEYGRTALHSAARVAMKRLAVRGKSEEKRKIEILRCEIFLNLIAIDF